MPRAPLRRRQQQVNRHSPFPRVTRKSANNSAALKAELEKKLAHKPIGPRPNDSDDSDRLVVKGSGRRGRNVPRQEIYASGGVGKGDQPGAYPSRAQRRQNMTRATKEILAKGSQQNGEAENFGQSSPLTNGAINKTSAKQNKRGPSAVPSSSAVNPQTSMLPSTRPTPTRENSILGTLKPRRRQPSILQALDQPDSSTLDLGDEEEFLPDAESTPVNTSANGRAALATPATGSSPQIPSSSTRKRKFDSSEPVQPSSSAPQRPTSPQTKVPVVSPQPSLPTVSPSVVKASTRSRRERARVEDDADVMAPPASSSSPSSSRSPPPPTRAEPPAQSTKKPRKREPRPPVPAMTTEQLQSLLMPKRPRRGARERGRANASEFDIPADDSTDDRPVSDDADESTFLPAKTGRRARRIPPKPARNKTGQKGANSGPSKLKSSTQHFTASVLTPSATSASSRRNRETKSPSQQPPRLTNTRTGAGRPKPSGGSHHSNKENMTVVSGGFDSDQTGVVRNKWSDIDAWDMDFEDVEVMTGSGGSSPMRR